MIDCNIDCRIIETTSVVDNKLEQGCLITVDKLYNNKKGVKNIWKNIKKDYSCAHLKIDGVFDGCIYNYISPSSCPG